MKIMHVILEENFVHKSIYCKTVLHASYIISASIAGILSCSIHPSTVAISNNHSSTVAISNMLYEYQLCHVTCPL